MPRIDVEIESTAGSTLGHADSVGHSVFARTHHADGWPVGWGHVAQTIDEEGSSLEALVLMTEPALPGLVRAWPIGIIEFAGPPASQVLTCVTEVQPFIDLIDLVHPAPWHADVAAWLHALQRLDTQPDTPRRALRLHDRAAADAHVQAAQQRFAAALGTSSATTPSR